MSRVLGVLLFLFIAVGALLFQFSLEENFVPVAHAEHGHSAQAPLRPPSPKPPPSPPPSPPPPTWWYRGPTVLELLLRRGLVLQSDSRPLSPVFNRTHHNYWEASSLSAAAYAEHRGYAYVRATIRTPNATEFGAPLPAFDEDYPTCRYMAKGVWRAASWCKLIPLAHYLDRYPWVFLVDSDVVFTNNSVSLTDAVQRWPLARWHRGRRRPDGGIDGLGPLVDIRKDTADTAGAGLYRRYHWRQRPAGGAVRGRDARVQRLARARVCASVVERPSDVGTQAPLGAERPLEPLAARL
jgi:hypothetical protein